jgi:hypothetical protein
MHRGLFLLAAAGFLAGSVSWMAGARRAYRRAVAVEHRGLQAAQWRSLTAKDALAGALLLSLVPVLVAKAVQGRTSPADWFCCWRSCHCWGHWPGSGASTAWPG